MQRKVILITGACAVSARSVLRSLRMSEKFKDAEFVGWDMCTLLYGVYAGEFDRIYKVPAVNDPQYQSVAQSILDKEKPMAVIVVPEVEVLYWAQHPFDVPHIVPPVKFAELAISKERLFDALADTGLVPKYLNVPSVDLMNPNFQNPLGYPVWIRDGSAATASAKGAYKAEALSDLQAWVMINPLTTHFQLSQFLPGRNLGCFCLFKDGKLVKMAQAQRIEYIMAKVSVCGITGNTSKGKLLNEDKIKNAALKAIDILCGITGETMNGLVVADMKEDEQGNPIITEINIRHVAFSSSFAMAGQNIAEAQLLLALNRDDEVKPGVEVQYPKSNLILRDVDGLPIYIKEEKNLKMGECIGHE
jgi:carbamoyl-phosphate synthase large subunit